MATFDVAWVTEREERRYTAEQLPLEIGGSERDGLRIAGVKGAAAVATLGAFGDRAFLRSAPGGPEIRVNGEPLTGSHFLASGDVISVGRTQVDCRLDGDTLRLEVSESSPAASVDEPITPIAYEPVARIGHSILVYEIE